MAEKLKIIPLGGLNEIGKNMTAYEYGGEIIVVDCGMAFPGDDMYGIDCVIPDVTYLIKNRSRLRGLFITHGHEDHIGAIPYVLKQVNMPIYCTRFTAGLIKLKLQEHRLLDSTKLVTVEAGQTVKAGKFQVEFIHVNHSIADSVAFAIHTRMGVVVHTGDFKIDSTPIDGEVIDLARFGALGKEGVLALLADSTNVERPGYTMSERMVGKTFQRQFTGCKQRIIVTTFASNVHRIQQVIDAAAACGRKVAVTGRSMENIMKVSTELGYMKVPKGVLMDINRIKGLPPQQQVIITTGSQGEEMSALYRMAFSTHKQIDIGPQDKVIISASAIPGNEVTVGRVINELFRKGADVVYDKADMLHVSGHACQEELKIIHALTKPKFFIPLHGEQRMLQIHKRVAEAMGMDPRNICVAENGSVIELTTKHMKCETSVPAGEVFVDGSGVGEVGAVVLNDRKLLAEDGMVVVVLSMSSHDHRLLCEPEIVTRGFVYVKESEELLQELRELAMSTVDGMAARRRKDDNEVVFYSFFITITSTALILLCTSMAAWYISRVGSLVSKIVYYLCVFSMVVPFQMVMYTLARTADQVHLNTPWTIPVVVQGHLVDVAAAPAVVVDDRHPVAGIQQRFGLHAAGAVGIHHHQQRLRLDPQEGIIAAEEGPLILRQGLQAAQHRMGGVILRIDDDAALLATFADDGAHSCGGAQCVHIRIAVAHDVDLLGLVDELRQCIGHDP